MLPNIYCFMPLEELLTGRSITTVSVLLTFSRVEMRESIRHSQTGSGFPWHMICDGDGESAKFRQQLLDRGFDEAGLVGKFVTLTAPHDLEDQMIADGHSQLLRGILSESCGPSVLTCSDDDFLKRLKNRKTAYMTVLAMKIASDHQLAERMPAPFVDLIRGLKEGRL